MSQFKLPPPFNRYYKSFIEGSCPFCNSDVIYCSRNNDVVFCRHYQCYVSTYTCESLMGENGSGGCKACNLEPAIYCPLEKTSIIPSDCSELHENHPFCTQCKSIKISIPSQSELRSDLVWVCDDCQKIVDFTKQKVSEQFSSN